MLDIIAIFIGFVLTLVVVGLIVTIAEHYIVGYIWRQVPCVSCPKVLCRAVVAEIKKYKNVHSVCEIGAGYGVLARYVARKCDVSVTALENVWFTYFIASICRMLPGGNNVRNVCADAFEYLKGENVHFNIGIAYLCPEVNDCLMDFMDKFDILILLDFPTSGVAPVRVVDVGHGFTRFNNKKYPHKLFIYK